MVVMSESASGNIRKSMRSLIGLAWAVFIYLPTVSAAEKNAQVVVSDNSDSEGESRARACSEVVDDDVAQQNQVLLLSLISETNALLVSGQISTEQGQVLSTIRQIVVDEIKTRLDSPTDASIATYQTYLFFYLNSASGYCTKLRNILQGHGSCEVLTQISQELSADRFRMHKSRSNHDMQPNM